MLIKGLLIRTLALVGLLACADQARAAEHGHEGHAKGDTKLTLDNGKKWQTDATLRDGMTAIRGEVAAALPAIHGGTFSPAQYAALAGKVEAELATIMSKCRLPANVDAQIHFVLADFFAGTEAMKGKGDLQAGAVKVVRALGAYGTHFEHPGWKPLVH